MPKKFKQHVRESDRIPIERNASEFESMIVEYYSALLSQTLPDQFEALIAQFKREESAGRDSQG